MTYFFTTLLQTLLPSTLLLACAWSLFHHLKLKKILFVSFVAFGVGIAITSLFPKGQVAVLSLNIFIFTAVIGFLASQFTQSTRLTYFWQFILLTLAALQWARNPNIAAITNTDVINTDFILHLSAVLFGVVFCLFLASWLVLLLAQYKTHQKHTALSASRLRWGLLIAFSLVIITPLIGEILLGLMKLQVIELTKTRLSFVAKANNISAYINYLSLAIGLILLALFHINILSPHKKAVQAEIEPIEKRKKIALFRTARRLITWGVAAFSLLGISQYYWDTVASQPLQLSEATTVKLDAQQQVHIPIEKVKDGNLHRFRWIADDGKAVRFFIINRLEDRLSLAVVFDACLLCGDQGYVMQDGQVVCVGCGVRMFKPSIGKPGGCNPVPIEDWQQTENEVIIHRSSLEMGLNLFSTIVEIEVIDPVDGSKLINTKTEFKYNLDGKTYFFANEKNLNLFRDNPEKYQPEETK
ncbi:hypothetical protein A4G18_09620 [Pasteurellaceae bacterium Pebbles2]|nr:hypothetical protein [Pasteurellaceae bacterium Pebbles2]